MQRIKAIGNKVAGKGERGELRLVIAKARIGGCEVWEVEKRSLFKVLGQSNSKQGQKGLTTRDFGGIIHGGFGSGLEERVPTISGIPRDSEDIVEVHWADGVCDWSGC